MPDITAEQLENIVKMLSAQGPMPMLSLLDWDHIIAVLKQWESDEALQLVRLPDGERRMRGAAVEREVAA